MLGTGDGAPMEVVALTLLDRADEPIGSSRLAEAFRQADIPVAEATAGRYLRHLDERGFTEAKNTTRGRVITDAGRQRLRQLLLRRRQDEHGARLWRAVNTTEIADLIDLLHVRRAVETEAARLAAARATDEERARICALTDSHVDEAGEGRDTIEPSLHFHRLMAEASHNRMLVAVARLLLDPANEPLEKLLGSISLDTGATLDLALDHRRLAEAVRAHDELAAETAMRAHMDKLIREVEAYRDRGAR